MSQRTRYLIVGYSRSGTTITHLAIKGHPNAAALNDEMTIAPFFTKGISTFTHGNDYPEEKQKGYSALFDALTLLGATDQTTAHGVKIACNSNKMARHLVGVLQNHLKDIKVLIIYRKDLVALLGSAQSGKKSGIMHSWYKGFDKRQVKPFSIAKWRMTAFAFNVFRMYRVLEELKETHDTLEVRYEDLLTDPDRFYRRVFDFLHLPAMTPTWIESKKVMPAPETYITNYDELKKRATDVENDRVPFVVMFCSRALGHLAWRLRSLLPKKRRKPVLKQ